MKMPALLTSVSIRPNRSSVRFITRPAVSGSAMSPAAVRKLDSSAAWIDRDVPVTAYPAPRNAATRPAPMPCEAPVTSATLGLIRRALPGRSARQQLLAAVDVVGGAGERRVGHDVHGERGDVGRAHHAADRQRGPELVAP